MGEIERRISIRASEAEQPDYNLFHPQYILSQHFGPGSCHPLAGEDLKEG